MHCPTTVIIARLSALPGTWNRLSTVSYTHLDVYKRQILLLATEMTGAEVARFKDLGLPLVVLDGNFEDVGVNCVAIGNSNSVRCSVEHLVSIGHRKIGYLKSDKVIRNFLERFEGYSFSMRHYGLEIPEDAVRCV